MIDNGLVESVERAYSNEEAQRFVAWQPDTSAIQQIGEIAFEILDECQPRPGECRHWTAKWVRAVRSRLGLPAVQVGGDLFAYGECVYRVADDEEFLDPFHPAFEQPWPGHSWLQIGDVVADISLPMTVIGDPNCQLTLRRVVESNFQTEQGPLRILGHTMEEFRARDLEYRPRGVYSDAAVDRHIEVGSMLAERESMRSD